ncbi:MAG: hypothetical protein Kow0090_02370 [Myxococcota bacterium]
MKSKFLMLILFFYLLSALSCGESDDNATVKFSIEFDDVISLKRAQSATGEGGKALYDLSRTGMIGKITVSAEDIESVETLFPQSEMGTGASSIAVEIEVKAGVGRRIMGTLFMNEGGAVSAFASKNNLSVDLQSGEEREVSLILIERLWGNVILSLAGNNYRGFVKAYPVEKSLGAILPPGEYDAKEGAFLISGVPLGYEYWFRLESAGGETADYGYDSPCFVNSESAACFVGEK